MRRLAFRVAPAMVIAKRVLRWLRPAAMAVVLLGLLTTQVAYAALSPTADTVADTVTNLSARAAGTHSVTLTWTAHSLSRGWDSELYDIRYSTEYTTEATWEGATQCDGEPAPQRAGSSETFTVTGLQPDTAYYFAIRTYGPRSLDEFPPMDWGGLSNVASARTLPVPGRVPPDVTTDAASEIDDTSATLHLGLSSTGTAKSVQVSFEWGLTTDYGHATQTAGMSRPGDWSFSLTGLAPATTYYFRARAVGDVTGYGDGRSFTTLPGPPMIGSIEPGSGRQGDSLTVIISGSGLARATNVHFGNGITVRIVSAADDRRVTVRIAIEGDAATGDRTIRVTTPGGIATSPSGFRVEGAAATAHLWLYLVAGAAGLVCLLAVTSLAVWLLRSKYGRARPHTGRPAGDEGEASRPPLETAEADGPAAGLVLPAQERAVNTGFAPAEDPGHPLDQRMPLATGGQYYFWLDVGKIDVHSIEKTPTAIPVEHLPSDATLTVALFDLEDGVRTVPGGDTGELRLLPDGTAQVTRQPVADPTPPLPEDLRHTRLFFPVMAPQQQGTFRLRCNIYFRQILVQSRLVQVMVASERHYVEDALRSAVDYTLSHSLRPDHLNRLAPHRLSLMVNSDNDKTHVLIFGQKDSETVKIESVLSPTELKVPIDNARMALRQVSWGDTRPWEGQAYRYQDQRCNIDRLEKDLANLAIGGYILYNGLIDKLAGGRDRAEQLGELMRKPGLAQVALRRTASHVLPAALFYDYPLYTQAKSLTLCESFIRSLVGDVPLEQTPCFNGECPSCGKVDHVCPSGFWGYRHYLGMPLSVEPGTDVPPEMNAAGEVRLVVCVATNLHQLDSHLQHLGALCGQTGLRCGRSCEEAFKLLQEAGSHVVYFYCHGGVKNSIPYLQVGSGEDYIDGSNLRAFHIRWKDPHPLVFINGCQTTALDPEQAINLVQDFVSAGGAGVIGTETTVFEPLACEFGEECLRLFLSGASSIGEAVRSTRLKLLREGNPLGLVYTPFVLPSIRLKR